MLIVRARNINITYKRQSKDVPKHKIGWVKVCIMVMDVQDFSQRIFIVSSKQALLYRRKQAGEAL